MTRGPGEQKPEDEASGLRKQIEELRRRARETVTVERLGVSPIPVRAGEYDPNAPDIIPTSISSAELAREFLLR